MSDRVSDAVHLLRGRRSLLARSPVIDSKDFADHAVRRARACVAVQTEPARVLARRVDCCHASPGSLPAGSRAQTTCGPGRGETDSVSAVRCVR